MATALMVVATQRSSTLTPPVTRATIKGQRLRSRNEMMFEMRVPVVVNKAS